MESNRLQKVNELLQQELAQIFRSEATRLRPGMLITVTEVRTTADLSIAKAYISIFPPQHRQEVMDYIVEHTPHYRKTLGNIVGKQMRIVPELLFFPDNTLDQAEAIEKELKGKGNNPQL